MRFIPLASSSHGNAYLVDDGETRLLLECGVSFKKLQKLSGYNLSNIAACLVTHEHGDHARSHQKVVQCGIPVYATAGTRRALDCTLLDLLKGDAIVIYACQIAQSRRAFAWPFIDNVLNGWKRAGLRTLAECEAYERDWKEKHNRKSRDSRKDSGRNQAYTPRPAPQPQSMDWEALAHDMDEREGRT